MPSVCLLGYFSQNNFGDEITNIITCALVQAEFGAGTAVHIINQGMFDAGGDRTHDHLAGLVTPFGIDLKIKSVWFDSILRDDYDALIVNNGGFGKSFISDIPLVAEERGISTRFHCVKAGLPTGARGESFARAIAGSEYAVFRSSSEYDSVRELAPAVRGVDIALIPSLSVSSRERNGNLVIAQRYSSDEALNMMQIVYGSTLALAWDHDVTLLASCHADYKLAVNSARIAKCSRLKVLRGWESPLSTAEEIASSDAVISFGRRHPLLFAAANEIPCAMIDFSGRIPDTVPLTRELPCIDHGVTLTALPRLGDYREWLSQLVRISDGSFSDLESRREVSRAAIGEELLRSAEDIICQRALT